MKIELLDDERVDDLERNGYRIIQKVNGFCFGIDAVLLSDFAGASEGEKVLDLGTGTGVIPILMAAKTEAEHLTGLEIQEEMSEMAARSVRLNGLENKITVVTGDIKEASKIFGRASFDVVTSNPPYIKDGRQSSRADKNIARHEALCAFEDVTRETGEILKCGGRFYLVHRPYRLTEIFETLKKYRLEPKRMRMVHPAKDKEANMVLIEAVKGGGMQLTAEAPLFVYDEQGVYTEEILRIYGKQQ